MAEMIWTLEKQLEKTAECFNQKQESGEKFVGLLQKAETNNTWSSSSVAIKQTQRRCAFVTHVLYQAACEGADYEQLSSSSTFKVPDQLFVLNIILSFCMTLQYLFDICALFLCVCRSQTQSCWRKWVKWWWRVLKLWHGLHQHYFQQTAQRWRIQPSCRWVSSLSMPGKSAILI